MRARAIWGLTLGLLSAASPVWAAPPEAEAPLPSYEAPIAAPVAFEPATPVEPEAEPNTGVGLMATGPFLLVGGGVLLGVSAVNYHRDMNVPSGEDDQGWDGAAAFLIWTPLIIVGSATVVAGSVLLGTGIASHRKHRQWRMTPTLAPLPGAQPGIGGLSFGIAGRF